MLDKSHPISLAEADRHICELEEEYDLLQYQIDGWCVWPVLRFPMAMAYRRLPWVNTIREKQWEWIEKVSVALCNLPRLLSLKPVRYVVRTYTSNLRSNQEEGGYRDVYFDDLLEEIDSYLKVERGTKRHFASRRGSLTSNIVSSDGLDLLVSFLARVSDPRHVSSIAHSLSSCLEKELELRCLTPAYITLMLQRFYWSEKLYVWLLKQVRPDAVFLLNAYNEHAFVAAAKKLQIEVIEFQHGAVNRHHPGYSWSRYALDYRDNMPVPDRIFLYGDFWKQELESKGFWGDSLRAVGSLRIDRYRSLKFERDRICKIVLTTQHVDRERLIDFVADFLKIAEGDLDFRFHIRLHPGEPDKEPYENAFGDNKHVFVSLGNEPPSTFQLLAEASFHLSIYSTCHYEALALGTPTVILPLAGYEVVKHLHKSGHAFFAQTPQELFDIIAQYSNHVDREVGAFYFRHGALKNMLMELQ